MESENERKIFQNASHYNKVGSIKTKNLEHDMTDAFMMMYILAAEQFLKNSNVRGYTL